MYSRPALSTRIFWRIKVATVLDNSEPVSIILRHNGTISVVSKKLMTSFSSVLTRAPITPNDVKRRYSKLRWELNYILGAKHFPTFSTFLSKFLVWFVFTCWYWEMDKEKVVCGLVKMTVLYLDGMQHTEEAPKHYKLYLIALQTMLEDRLHNRLILFLVIML